jgi:hypothetical protein
MRILRERVAMSLPPRAEVVMIVANAVASVNAAAGAEGRPLTASARRLSAGRAQGGRLVWVGVAARAATERGRTTPTTSTGRES